MDRIETKQTIYFVWSYLNWGGAQIYFLAIINAALRDWNILVLLPKGSSVEFLGFLKELDVNYEFLEYSLDNSLVGSLSEKISRQFARIKSEREIFRRLSRIDLKNSVIHIEVAPWQSWLLLTALLFRGASVFVTLHNYVEGGGKLRRILWKWRIRFVSRLHGFHVFTANQDAKDRFRGLFTDKFHKTINVTYPGVDPEQIAKAATGDPAEIRRQFSVPEDKFVVLCVGQFIDRKGRWVFLEAAKKAAKIDDDLIFVWLMPELPRESEQAHIDEYELGNRFIPVLSASVGSRRIDVLRFFRVADVFALPSFIEGLPIVILEAMALGIPIISTNVFAIPEAVKDRETGLLIEPGDSDALSDAILMLRTDEKLRKALSANGSRFVLEHFDQRVSARTALDAYGECFPDG